MKEERDIGRVEGEWDKCHYILISKNQKSKTEESIH